MNKRYKFRAYHKKDNKIYGVYGFNECLVFTDCLDTCKPLKMDDVILLQSTGLEDINGKTIFDGDIIENHREERGEVYFDKDTASYVIRDKDEDVIDFLSSEYIKSNYAIVGNIFTDSNILK